MDKGKKLAYDIGYTVLGGILVVSAAAAIYAHMWLGQVDSDVADLMTLFSEDFRQERELMQDLRIIGSFLFVATLGVTTALGKPYFEQIEDSEWELKKAIAAGALLTPFGLFAYYQASDLFPQAIGLAVAIVGVVIVVLDVGMLLYLDEDGASSSTSPDGAYCPDCGEQASSSDAFCRQCGSEL